MQGVEAWCFAIYYGPLSVGHGAKETWIEAFRVLNGGRKGFGSFKTFKIQVWVKKSLRLVQS